MVLRTFLMPKLVRRNSEAKEPINVFILVKKNQEQLQRQILCLWLIMLLLTHNWLDLLAVQGTLKSLLQHHNSKASILNPKGNQSWMGGTGAEVLTLGPPDVKSWLFGKDPDAGKYWRQEEKGMTQDEMVGWHHRLNGHEFEQTPGDGEGPGSRCAAVYGVARSQTWVSN